MSLSLITEKTLWNQNITSVVGIDEVGRGCLAGPLVVSGVVFPRDHQPIEGVNDSKVLSPNKRIELAEQIKKKAFCWSTAFVEVEVINRIGISPAFTQAIEAVIQDLTSCDVVLLDGKYTPKLPSYSSLPIQAIVKGDAHCYSIAAASILAKVERDRYMEELSFEFPKYGWSQNKGYGTKRHRDSIIKFGVTKHHRHLFIRKVLATVN